MKIITQAILSALLLVSYAGVAYAAYLGGRASYHDDIIADMDRYKEAPIRCMDPTGRVYILSGQGKQYVKKEDR